MREGRGIKNTVEESLGTMVKMGVRAGDESRVNAFVLLGCGSGAENGALAMRLGNVAWNSLLCWWHIGWLVGLGVSGRDRGARGMRLVWTGKTLGMGLR